MVSRPPGQVYGIVGQDGRVAGWLGGAGKRFQIGTSGGLEGDSARISRHRKRIAKDRGLALDPRSNVSSIIRDAPLAGLEVGPFWQRFAYRKASRSKMRCAGSSGRYSRRTSSRKSSVTPTT